MDARKHAWAVALLALLSVAARYQTPNFIVTAPTSEMAQQVGQAAEKFRREITQDWLGYVMPQWSKPCPITVRIERGAGGVTTFNFANGEVFGWQMTVQGPLDQILDSVLPHEVTHTIFASHFRQPLPRWADEGACTTVESPKERDKQKTMLVQFLRTGRGIAFPHMFRMKEYPRDVLPLYAQGHSLSTFLVGQKGKSKFMEYLADGLKSEDWTAVTQQHYGYRGLGELQNAWLDWVQKGWPGADYSETSIAMRLASGRAGQGGTKDGFVYRGQSPESASSTRGTRMAPVRTVASPGDEARLPAPRGGSSDGAAPVENTPVSAVPGDSSGWHAPKRPSSESLRDSPSRLGETRPHEETRPRGETDPPSGFTGTSRYERSGPAAAAEFPGQHLPEVARQAAFPQQGGAGLPAARMSRGPFFSPAQPMASMPCVGGL